MEVPLDGELYRVEDSQLVRDVERFTGFYVVWFFAECEHGWQNLEEMARNKLQVKYTWSNTYYTSQLYQVTQPKL